jgi:hypothetical protein
MAKKAHQDFWALLEALAKKQESEWNANSTTRKVSKDARSTYQDLQLHFSSCRLVTWQTIKGYQKKNDFPIDFDEERLIMVLPPLEKDASFVPVMSITYKPCDDFDESCLKIRVFLLKKERTGPETGLVGVGFRIESPEKYCQMSNGNQDSSEIGMHDFYHAQLITDIKHGPPLLAPQWLPCTQPSFPLWAVNPIDAICNLVLTLYGGRYYKEFLSELSRPSDISCSKEFCQANEIYFK